MLIKFISVVLLVSVILILVSFFWPYVTSQPRPEALTRVREFVLSSSFGPSVTNVLGIADEPSQPINIGSITTNVASGAISSVREYTANALFLSAVRQLAGQYNELSPDQQEEVRSLICTSQSQEVEPALPAP